MAERNQKVLDRVRQELAKNAKLGSRELFELAKGFDKAVGQETLQQFHARYVLPIKREGRPRGGGGAAAAKGGRRARKKKGTPQTAAASSAAGERTATRRSARESEGPDRDNIRLVLLKFAQDFADADSRSEIVKVLSKVDDYVNRIAGDR